MTGIEAMWLGIGIAIGVLHAVGIWRATTHARATSALFGLMRLVIVALVLTATAVGGGLIPTAMGWVGGFFTTVCAIWLWQGAVQVRRPWGHGRTNP